MPNTNAPDFSAFARAIAAIDAFLYTVRNRRSLSGVSDSIAPFLIVQSAIDSAARLPAGCRVPPEPIRSNYRARLETLAFELHRLQPLLQQEHTRLCQTLRESSTRQAWAEALSQTQ